MPFLFKLHAPDEFIVGGGFFLRFVPVPLSLAWAAFRQANGASTLEGFRRLIGKHLTNAPSKDPYIGCNILSEPFYFSRSHWMPSARYMRRSILAGKGNFEEKQGQELWNEVKTILGLDETVKTLGPATMNAIDKQRYGQPVLVAPRLGQGSFRTLVTTAYSYRCAVTRERTLPCFKPPTFVHMLRVACTSYQTASYFGAICIRYLTSTTSVWTRTSGRSSSAGAFANNSKTGGII